MDQKIKVMIAGVGGASLGTEIYKALQLTKSYEIYGCDISSTAYGLYEVGFAKTYLVNRHDYVASVINACMDTGVKWLIPGGEQPMLLLGAASDSLTNSGIYLLANSPEIISCFSNKQETFSKLAQHGVAIPQTVAINQISDLNIVGLPCIIKPSTGTGGSHSVFFAVTEDEAMIYAEFIRRNGSQPIAQEYIDIEEGEFTIGVLSLPDQQIAGSIALRRDLNAKLSIGYRGRGGIISSGYSQGYIDEYQEICQQAELIAQSIGSCGPINIQARVRDNKILPFEINPRFSASTYLRAMAGFNEVDMMLKYFELGIKPQKPVIQAGWYLRSLSEQYIMNSRLKK
ncbi:ATP-grasp domain-containing protein [Laspinema olomoucense]|nr:ATP-grasp domain-containing protein [Laspinema sp. D3d]